MSHKSALFINLKSFAGATLLVITGCQQHQPRESRLAGHFEASDSATLAAFEGKQALVPEYLPSQGVLISFKMLIEHHQEQMAKELLDADIDRLWVTVPADYTQEEEDEDFKTLYDLTGANRSKITLLAQPAEGKHREWARDFGPWTAKSENGELRLIDFNYYPDRASDDYVPQSLAEAMQVTRLSLPIYIEGGNFMNNEQGHCLMTDKVLDANATVKSPGDMILDRSQIIAYFKKFAGCKDVLILPSLPYEGTRHIDLWAKFLNDHTILLGEIGESIAQLPAYSADNKERVIKVKNFLDDRARQLSALGYDIVRIPMPAPVFAEDGYNLFRSYTNSLTLNGQIFLPRYIKPASDMDGVDGNYIDALLTDEYEQKVEEIHRKLGFSKIHWVPSDSMIGKGGAVHCTTMQVAR